MARSFNGTTDWYSTAAKQWPQSAVTFSLWVKPTTVSVAQSLFGANAFGSGALLGYNQVFINASGGINARIMATSTAYIGRTTSNTICTANAWQHIAYIWSGGTTSAAVSIYLNGTQVDNANDTAGSFSAPYSGALLPMYIGAQNGNTVASPTWQAGLSGALADLALWNVALTAGEVAGLASGQRPMHIRWGSIVLFPPLDGLVTVEPDLSGSALNLTAVTGAPAAAAGAPLAAFTQRWIQTLSVPPAFNLMSQIVM